MKTQPTLPQLPLGFTPDGQIDPANIILNIELEDQDHTGWQVALVTLQRNPQADKIAKLNSPTLTVDKIYYGTSRWLRSDPEWQARFELPVLEEDPLGTRHKFIAELASFSHVELFTTRPVISPERTAPK